MPAHTLILFYKDNKLSTWHTGSTHQTLLSANNWNLSETTNTPPQVRLLATDAQESTVSIGSKSQRNINYSPYGNDNCPPTNPLLSRFTGQNWLPSAIGYLLGNGHRLFNPGLMRFHSRDNLSPFEKGGINAYAYCENDPVNKSDPSGMYSLVKLILGGYKAKNIIPRLDQENPNLTKREYRILKEHIDYQKYKASAEIQASSSTLRKKGEERSLNAALQESKLTTLVLEKVEGKKSRYVTPTSFSPFIIPSEPSHTWPKISSPSPTYLDFTGNYIDPKAYAIRTQLLIWN
ncbi:RHS repeat-associated core domain-containing protein [Pseudomonas putida]|uniref:RHS repeat-associated core domain-containing protein n=1 Tax=Pseudomonas putida TaxID=303 RepID=UPI0039068DD6